MESDLSSNGSTRSNGSTIDDHRTLTAASITEPELAMKEDTAVKRSKCLVFAVLIAAAVIVAMLVHNVASNDEYENFTKDVETFSSEIKENAELVMRTYASAVQSLSTSITAMAISTHQSWPNVTIPFFEIKSNEIRMQSHMDELAFAPIVQQSNHQKKEWESYATQHQQWIQDGLDYQGKKDVNPGLISQTIFDIESSDNSQEHPFLLPLWQIGPAPTNASSVNLNLMSHKTLRNVVERVMKTGRVALSPIVDPNFLLQYTDHDDQDHDRRELLSEEENVDPTTMVRNPHAMIVQPVFASFQPGADIVGVVVAVFSWNRVFNNAQVIQDLIVVLSSTCGSQYSYRINFYAELIGAGGDFHDRRYEKLGHHQEFKPFQEEWEELIHRVKSDESECEYTFDIYPTSELESKYTTLYPIIYAIVVASIFAGTSIVFVLYDCMVQRRQSKVMQSAVHANAIVSNMFPATVKDRLLQNAEEQVLQTSPVKKKPQRSLRARPKRQLRSFLDFDGGSTEMSENDQTALLTAFSTKPIADLFTDATIMFADISGFTAWSSVREPTQVFTLLETVYAAFDKVAKSLKVFKVETVGDCYVAVAGLPSPRDDHAVVMAMFATECLRIFADLTKRLEIVLGPGTGGLCLRVGLHSGPVTAGVLRGDNARFQLFGDTVNVASRMESTGEKGRIQVSQEAADILIAAGLKLTPREQKVEAKGKGQLQTYWLTMPTMSSNDSVHSSRQLSQGSTTNTPRDRPRLERPLLGDNALEEMDRLVDWNANNLLKLLRAVERRRCAVNVTRADPKILKLKKRQGKTALDEVKEIIKLPKFDVGAYSHAADLSKITLPREVEVEARNYVRAIARRYRTNPFHNFEHASHVAMSVVKLLSRIVAPDEIDADDHENTASQLHDHTYGITSDPLTCFGCVFAALIHDVDHAGIPNSQLASENPDLAKAYRNQSIAEQNSVDIAWDLLMEDRFSNFRAAIFVNKDELIRFRQLLVNSVMATDIMDKQLKELRNNRWRKAFDDRIEEVKGGFGRADSVESCIAQNDINRKATIVIEHIIQASDVSHTMQHWHIYRKWNEKLYAEMYQAFKDGRNSVDPTDGWYQGEIGFFDFYIIPLARKLADCGVFGVSSFEYLNFAIRNREEWASKGEQIVIEMRQNVVDKPSSFDVGKARVGL